MDLIFRKSSELNRKPVIRIEGGSFVGYIEDAQYLLGDIEHGLAPGVENIIKLRMEHSSICLQPPLSHCGPGTEVEVMTD
jgi:hypothetical protein